MHLHTHIQAHLCTVNSILIIYLKYSNGMSLYTSPY